SGLSVPAPTMVTPLTSQTFVTAGMVATGPQSSKSTDPVASSGLVAPVTWIVALSVTAVPGCTVPFVDACVVSCGAQCWNLPRSLTCSSESPAAEARLLIWKLEKQTSPN